jgi:hypothetical protein
MECTKCHQVKELAKGKRWCKDCKNEYERNRYANKSEEDKEKIRQKEKDRYNKNKEQVYNKTINIDLTSTKQCTICNTYKTLDNFYKNNTKGTIRSECKLCASTYRKEYYKENREYTINKTANYIVEKMKTDPLFKLERRLRSRIYTAFLLAGESKQDRTWKYIDCSPIFLKEWIEFQLYDGMTLENYGKIWHIDHVKPCASFDLSKEEDIKECFCWMNLRPLLTSKNFVKSSKTIQFEIMLQELKVKCFMKQKGIKNF